MPEQNRYAIKIVPYDSKWPLKFEAEKQELLHIPEANIVAIEHTGSTSVPSLAAKPIIDMFAGVHSLHNKAVYENLLSQLGYHYMETGMTGRHLFAKECGGERTHHLHILPIEGLYERKEILFRDYLRKHPALSEEYGELKYALSQQYHSDPEGYTRAKTAFIQRVDDLARIERGLPLQNVWE